MAIVNTILCKMSNLSKPRIKFLAILFSTMMYIPGKVNYRNLSRYSNLSEMTYLRHFRQVFAFSEFNLHLIKEAIVPCHRLVAGLDCSYIQKSGRQTYGLDYFFSGTASCSKRGLEISALAVIDVDAPFGYTLSVSQTPSSDTLGSDEDNRIDHYLKQVEDHAEPLKELGISYVCVDGYYSKKRFIDGVLAQGLDLIGKLRSDANLRYLFDGQQKKGPGAPKRYDGKVCFHAFIRWDLVDTIDQVTIYTAVLNAPRFKRDLRVVCLVDTSNPEKQRYALLFSTDIALDAMTLVHFYKARFQIEFLFRDAKQFTGLADAQARDKNALDFHFNAAMTTLNLLRFMDRSHHRNKPGIPCSIASWKKRAYNRHLIERIIQHLDIEPDLIKLHPGMLQLYEYGVIAA